MVVHAIEIEPLAGSRSASPSNARRFSPADFSEPVEPLCEVALADHAHARGREPGAPAGAPVVAHGAPVIDAAR